MQIKTLLTYLYCLFFCSFSLLAQDSLQLSQNNDTTRLDSIKVDSTDLQATKILNFNQDSIAAAIESVRQNQEKLEIFDFKAALVQTSKGYNLVIKALNEANQQEKQLQGSYLFTIGKKEKQNLIFERGEASKIYLDDNMPATLYLKHQNKEKDIAHLFRFSQNDIAVTEGSKIPKWVALLPPLIAIFLALIFREAIASLFIGIWCGIFLINGFSFRAFFDSFRQFIDTYLLNTIADKDHLSIIVFSILIGGMVAIISRNGGMAGVVNRLSKRAKSARSSQLVTWFLGVAIFFDDYANTLIVGNTARPLTDRYRVSREKLAYIVDSTAAPVAAIAFVTTWIGAELGYIGDATAALGINETAYDIFLKSLTYSFYPILTLLFMLFLILSKRDFGPMLTAERRARTTGKLSNPIDEENDYDMDLDDLAPVKNKPHRAYNAVLPIATVVIATLLALFYTGSENIWQNGNLSFMQKLGQTFSSFANVRDIIGNGNSYVALLWSSMAGIMVAIMLTLFGRIMSIRATMDSLVSGMKTMMPAMIILILAWTLATITKDLHTADYLSNILQGNLDPKLLPMITFGLAGITAFSTGSSWSTMAILYPILLPTTWALCQEAGLPADITMPIFYSVTSCVLAGSVFGDHCSPISDTTILSSLSSNCNHIDHVRTQLPYALTVGLVSVSMTGVSIWYQLPSWMCFAIGITILMFIGLLFGRKVPDFDVATGTLIEPKKMFKRAKKEKAKTAAKVEEKENETEEPKEEIDGSKTSVLEKEDTTDENFEKDKDEKEKLDD
ncbi:MAG: Na+/H+ antiporter NhaC family protein [Chitinophagales bacterium]